MTKIKKVKFERKRGGKNGGWGVGLDYLLKDCWNDLDRLTKDNYYGRHDARLINFLFSKIFLASEEAILEMQRFCDKNSDGLKDWIKKIKKIQNFGKNSKILSEKVIFIDITVQFLRATYLGDKTTWRIKEKKVVYKRKKFGGVVAWGGFKQISGIVKVVLDEADFPKFKKGKILVTDETSVNFLPLIQKAVAIITDNGGVLCHAAIVSREMKKPCIIGTKIATKVLKDGDLVEIDANEGVVKILKRA